MTAKKEEEEKEKLRQEAAHAQWESEKEMIKSPEFREVNSRRRQSIGENYLKKDKKVRLLAIWIYAYSVATAKGEDDDDR